MSTWSRREFMVSGTLLTTLACGTSRLTGGSPWRPQVDDDLAAAADLVDQAVADGATPGCALSVWSDGVELLSHQAGVADRATGAQVGPDTVFRIGSVTKQFAAALVLDLATQGRLALTDPVHVHLPAFVGQPAFTVLELLTHTAGIHDGEYPAGLPTTRAQTEQAELIARQAQVFDFPPGTAWLYSNANYILIGALIERVTGAPLAVAARPLLSRLDLGTAAFDALDDVVPGRATGYAATGDPATPFTSAADLDPALTGAAGAMRATAADLGRWHQLLFRGEAGPATAAAMTTPARLRDGALTSTHRFSPDDAVLGDTQYGLGLRLDTATTDGSLIAAHEGAIDGFAAYLATHVGSGLTFACLCNVDLHGELPFRSLRRRLFRAVLPAR
ncbi:MAG: serine hydrolase domain-containing protein [Kofleriaceae bacterium]